MKIYYSEKDFNRDLPRLVGKSPDNITGIYGVPRGGIPFASALASELSLPLISKSDIDQNTLIADDVIDSGLTRNKFSDNFFIAIHSKISELPKNTIVLHTKVTDWIHYFWEGEEQIDSITDSVTRMLQYIGEDVNREGLLETPKRVIKAWDYIFSGYKIDPKELIKQFSSDGCDEMVILKDIEIYSMCEHHLLPFIGKAHVAYIPNGKVIGVSKLARIVDCFARRAQIQERIGEQVTDILMNELNAKGAACVIEAQHLCMKMRGVEKQHSSMVTSSIKGTFKNDAACRQEFLGLIK